MLGISNFLTNQDRYINARSVNISHLIYIDYEDFNQII